MIPRIPDRRHRIGPGAALLVGAFCLTSLWACGPELPEPESKGAKLYVEYCSGSGCHDPIPPQVDSMGYWNNQYDRMLVLMTDQGWKLPSPEEDRIIRAYLEKHALK
jgi:hypothetical protein